MPLPTQDEVQRVIAEKCDALKAMLLEKNRRYGNSALEPIGVFAKGLTARQQIGVRIDDKIKRIQNQQADDNEDSRNDLAGYLILDSVAEHFERMPDHG